MRSRWIPLVAAALALAGCGSSASAPDVDPAPASPPSASPNESAAPLTVPEDASTVRGLDVRYVDSDGEFKVLRVPDFPR